MIVLRTSIIGLRQFIFISLENTLLKKKGICTNQYLNEGSTTRHCKSKKAWNQMLRSLKSMKLLCISLLPGNWVTYMKIPRKWHFLNSTPITWRENKMRRIEVVSTSWPELAVELSYSTLTIVLNTESKNSKKSSINCSNSTWMIRRNYQLSTSRFLLKEPKLLYP
jgi:hypothetical protein